MTQEKPIAITHCLCHRIVLTRRCGHVCGYCDYPSSASRPIPSQKRLERLYRGAARLGAVQVEITGGEGIADHPETIGVLRYYGLPDYVSYLECVFSMALHADGRDPLLPVPHLGSLSLVELRRIKPFIPCVKILLESADPRLATEVAHADASCKAPEKRLEAILDAGRAHIPTTSGILVGIGESAASRVGALRLLAEAHRRYGHIQNVVIERFKPRPGTRMADWPPASVSDVLQCVAEAKRIFGADFPVTVHALEDLDLLQGALEAGARDFGDAFINGDSTTQNRTLERLALLRSHCAARGAVLRERPPVFPAYQDARWLSDAMLQLIQERYAEEPFGEMA